MRIGHRKEIRKLSFRAKAWNVSFRISLRWSIHISTQLIKPIYLQQSGLLTICNRLDKEKLSQ